MGLKMERTGHDMDSHFLCKTNKDGFDWKKQFNEPQNINRYAIHIILNSVFTKCTTHIKVGLPIVILLFKTSCKEWKVSLNSTPSIEYWHIYKDHDLMISWFSHCNNNIVRLFALMWGGMGNWFIEDHAHGKACSLFLRYQKEITNKAVV